MNLIAKGISAGLTQAQKDQIQQNIGGFDLAASYQRIDADYKAKVQGLLAASSASIVFFGDSTEAGVGTSGASVYGQANSYINDGWGAAFTYSLITADTRFNPPSKLSRSYAAGLSRSSLDAPFPCIRLTKLNDKFERFEIQNNSTVLSTTLTIYHNLRTADTAARFRVIVNRVDTGAEVANVLIDTYAPQVSYGSTVSKQSNIAKTSITLSSAQRLYTVTLTDVETLDRGSGVSADGTALYFGCTFGQGVAYNNLAVSSSTLRNDSPDNILRGIATEERLELGLTFNPNIVFIGWGTNDSKTGISTTALFRQQYLDFIAGIRAARGDCVIILITDPAGASGSIYENNVVYNEVVRSVATEANCILLDVESLFKQMPALAYSDTVHPSAYGYSMITGAACSALGLQAYTLAETRQASERIILQELEYDLTASTNTSTSYVDIFRVELTPPNFAKSMRVTCKIVAAATGDIVDDSFRVGVENNISGATLTIDETPINIGGTSSGAGLTYCNAVLCGRYTPSIDALKSLATFDVYVQGKEYQMKIDNAQHTLLIEWLG